MIIATGLLRPQLAGSPRATVAPASTTATADSVRLSPLGRVLRGTGHGMAKLGGFGGMAIGAALGVGAGLALGSLGWLVPVVGAVTLGAECVDARRAQKAFLAGPQSPEFQQRKRTNASLTSIGAATQVLAGVGGVGAMTAGLVWGGLPGGLIAGAAAALATAVVVVTAGHKAERAMLAAAGSDQSSGAAKPH